FAGRRSNVQGRGRDFRSLDPVVPSSETGMVGLADHRIKLRDRLQRRKPEGGRDQRARFSIRIAIPCPPPMQAEATPYRPPLRRSSCIKVRTRRAPVAPRGCPSAIAPPFTLTLSRSSRKSFSTA